MERLINAAMGAFLGVFGIPVFILVDYRRKNDGWHGAASFGAGIFGHAGLTGYGAYAAARQSIRGLHNTPEYFSKASEGVQLWDQPAGQWVTVNLEDAKDLPATDDGIRAKGKELWRTVSNDEDPIGRNLYPVPSKSRATCPTSWKSTSPSRGMDENANVTDYYLFLGVNRNAPQEEIRRAFVNKTLRGALWMNLFDLNGELVNDELPRVYNVLSNPVSRDEYDRSGDVTPQNVRETAAEPIDEVLGATALEPLLSNTNFDIFCLSTPVWSDNLLAELGRRRRLRIAQGLCGYLDSEETGLESAKPVLRHALSSRIGPQFVIFAAQSYRCGPPAHVRQRVEAAAGRLVYLHGHLDRHLIPLRC